VTSSSPTERGPVNLARIHLWIEGRVQGVCFRHYTREEANRLGVVGWVRNLFDGRVEAVIEGEPGAVEQMAVWCHHGPPMAQVLDVKMQREAPTGEFRRFEVTR